MIEGRGIVSGIAAGARNAPLLFSMRQAFPLISAAVVALAPVACDSSSGAEKPVEYGDPVGIRLEASATSPEVELAVAASKGVDMEAAVMPLASVLHKAITACPGFIAERASGDVAQIAFSVTDGKVTRPSRGQTPGETCVGDKLEGSPVALPGRFDAVAEIRLPQKAPATP